MRERNINLQHFFAQENMFFGVTLIIIWIVDKIPILFQRIYKRNNIYYLIQKMRYNKLKGIHIRSIGNKKYKFLFKFYSKEFIDQILNEPFTNQLIFFKLLHFTMKLFNKFFLFAVCFITVTAQIPSQHICPQVCNCLTLSEQCELCLESKFNRYYSTLSTCPCLPGYKENTPPIDACCAKNCSSCYQQGCYQCRKNWTKILNQDQYICTCKKNYEYQSSIEDCLCLSDINSTNQLKFYAPSRFQCYVCPQGCSCDASGCYSCPDDTNREIKLTIYNVWSCFCKNDYVENKNGSCVPSDEVIVDCPANRTLINNTCVCTQPYYQIFGQCLCKSYISQKFYYIYQGICYPCPALCICNQYGCIHCSSQAQRYIYENNCSCNSKTVQVDGECLCISPYDSFCNCNSKYAQYASIFYQYNVTNTSKICAYCPIGCICDQITSQISCNSSTHRNSSGQCIQPFIQLDGQCIDCQDNFIYVNNSCKCPTITHNLSLFYDQQNQICQKCPDGCSCNETGCYQCNLSLNRIIQSNSYNKFTCYCDASNLFKQNSLGICECVTPYIYDSTNKNCSCTDPYYLDGNECQCKAKQNSIQYYNSLGGCRPCPKECNCSTFGCVKCSSQTGRVVIRESPQSLIFICPCFPIGLNDEAIEFCTKCPSNQYLWKNECINCDPGCLTCDENGCLSCINTTQLNEKNRSCDCWGGLVYNGYKCLCAKGNFVNPFTRQCSECPLKCLECQLNIVLSGMIDCIECNTSNFRKDDIANKCPCIDYYVQAPTSLEFCCHWSCKNCTMSGCIACLPFTFRELNNTNPSNITCSCPSGFIQTYNTFCQCPRGTYLYTDECLPCPGYCLECIRINLLINCLVCKPGLNRKSAIATTAILNNMTLQIYDCVCEQSYVPYINEQYCYPQGCLTISKNGICELCDYDRNMSQDGLDCNCKPGKYENSFFHCQPCSEGCIQCISYEICRACNTSRNYYLILNKQTRQIKCIVPKQSDKILSQTIDKIAFEFESTQASNLKTIQIYLIQLNNQKTSKNTIKLNVIKFYRKQENKNISLIEFNNLTHDQLDYYLLFLNSSDRNQYQEYFQLHDQIYERKTLLNPYLQDIFIRIFIVILMVTSLVLHILGQKSNQLMYYCQTIYFVAMNVKDSHMYIVPLLNYFRITTFNFTFNGTESPFDRLLSDWTLFIEKCDGNYNYFSMDNNLIRNSGLALYLSLQTIFFSIVFRIIYYFLYNSRYKSLAKKYKKIVYRFIEWSYKVTMYPLIFFSLCTLINYKRQYSLVNQQFRQVNFRLSVLILICYAVITALQITFQQISKIHRYEIIIHYIFSMFNSIIIIYSIYNNLIFLMMIMMLLKSFLQNISQSHMRQIGLFYKYTSALGLIQCLVILPIYFCNKSGTIILVLLYIFGVIIVRILLIWNTHIYYKFAKNIRYQQERKASQIDQSSVYKVKIPSMQTWPDKKLSVE